MNVGYNPDFNPTGIEGGIDTNLLPWIALPQAPGMFIKPLRASSETGTFTVIGRLQPGAQFASLVHLGAMDMLVLSGAMTYPEGPLAATFTAGTWGYVPANCQIARLRADEETEFLEIHLKSGSTEILYWKDLLSGALIKSVCERAKDFAIKRSIELRSNTEGVSVEDLQKALRVEYKENEIFPKGDGIEDWLKLLDYEPDAVANIKPVRSKKSAAPTRRSII